MVQYFDVVNDWLAGYHVIVRIAGQCKTLTIIIGNLLRNFKAGEAESEVCDVRTVDGGADEFVLLAELAPLSVASLAMRRI